MASTIGLPESFDDCTCIICLEPMDFGQQLGVCFPCKHQFHEKCLDTWLGSSNLVRSSCCTCRQHIITILVVKFTKSSERSQHEMLLSAEDRTSLCESLRSRNSSRVKNALSGLMTEVANTSYEGSTMLLVRKLGLTPHVTQSLFQALNNHWVNDELIGEALLLWLGLLVGHRETLAVLELLTESQMVVETLVKVMSKKNQLHIYDSCLSVLSYMHSQCDDSSVVHHMIRCDAISSLLRAMERRGSEHLTSLSFWLWTLYNSCPVAKQSLCMNHEATSRFITSVLRLPTLYTNRSVCIRVGKLTLQLAHDNKRIRHALKRSDALATASVVLASVHNDEELRKVYYDLINLLEMTLLSRLLSFTLRR